MFIMESTNFKNMIILASYVPKDATLLIIIIFLKQMKLCKQSIG